MNDPHASLLQLADVAIGYTGASLLSGIDLRIRAGDLLGVVGPNGAGKSTLLKTMLGVLPPLHGRLTRRPGLSLGYVPQRSRIDPIFPLTALEMVQLGGLGMPRPGRGRRAFCGSPGARALGVLERLGIGHTAHHPFRDLSGGQQQRVLIARALIRDPALLILDEPTQGMDLPSERRLLDTISALNRDRGMAIVLVVHQIARVADLVHRLILINKDMGLFIEGPAQDILTDARLSALYGYPMKAERHQSGRVSVFAKSGGAS